MAKIDDLLGDFEEQRFIINISKGKEKEIIMKPLTVGELHEAIRDSQIQLRKEKLTDDTSKLEYQNYAMISKSLVQPSFTIEQIKGLHSSIYQQLLTIVQRLTIINPFDKKK